MSKDNFGGGDIDLDMDALQAAIAESDWAKERAKKTKNQIFDETNYLPGMMPESPDFEQIYDPLSMSIADKLQGKMDAISMDRGILDQLRGEAKRTGISNFTKNELARLAEEERYAKSDALAQARAREAEQRAMGSMRGGLNASAAASLGRASMNSALDMGQQVARNASQQRFQAMSNDEKQRLDLLSAMPGVESQYANFDLDKTKAWGTAYGKDIDNQMRNAEAQNAWRQNKFNQYMGSWAANKAADAQVNAANKANEGCWLITKLSHFITLPEDEAELLTAFKRHMLREDLVGAKFYIRRCGRLVKKMDEQGFDWTKFTWFNDSLVTLLRAGEMAAAHSLFFATVYDLIEKYWSDCQHEWFVGAKEERAKKIAAMKALPEQKLEDVDCKLDGPCSVGNKLIAEIF